MIRDWLTADGKTKRYDTLSGHIVVLNFDGSVYESTKPASQDDLDEYYSIYPQYSLEENESRISMVSTIQSGVESIDNFLAIDGITIQQINDIYDQVKLCIDNYAQYQYFHQDVEHAINILISKSFILQVKIAKELAQKNNLQTNTILNYEIRISNNEASTSQLKTRIDDYGIP